MTANLTIETFPNEAAADYIHGKAVADPKNFGNLPDQLKQRAFTVAGIEQLDALRRIRDAVAKLPEGASWDEAKREIASEMSPYTGGDDKAAKARADFMLRTHGFQAYAVARHQQQMSVAQDFPYWKYETVGDARVRPGHAALDGKVLRADDPWWKTHYPPWDWGCRCIVVAIDEDDVEELGLEVTPDGGHMPATGQSESFTFDASDVSGDLDMLVNNRDDADCRAFADMARNYTVNRDDGSECTMWDHMLERKMKKTANALSALTERDGNERAAVRDFTTGKPIGDVVKGDSNSVSLEVDDGATVCTLHTHPNGNNTPSPADLLFGLNIGSKADFIAAGRWLRRWRWLKTPEEGDRKLIAEYDSANKARILDLESWTWFLERMEANGYIEMRVLP